MHSDIRGYWNGNWEQWENSGKPSSFAQTCLAKIKEKGCLTLLDVGCGGGRDSVFFAGNGLNVTALDVSDTALSKITDPRIEKICHDTATFDFSVSFDVIYAHLSLHYFDDLQTRAIVGRIFASLKQGGLFCMRCKSVRDPLFGKGRKIGENMFVSDHFRHFFDVSYAASLLNAFSKTDIRETAEDYYGKSAFIDCIAEK